MMNELQNDFGVNFNMRRVINLQRTVNVYGLFDDGLPKAVNCCVNGLTQGYNFNGCGIIIKLNEELKSVMPEDLNAGFSGRQVRIDLGYDDFDDKDDLIEATVLRAGIPRTEGYDLFCALQFDFVPSKISRRISQELKKEDSLPA